MCDGREIHTQDFWSKKPEGKSHLERPTRRLYYIQMNVKERRMGRCKLDSYGSGCPS